MNFDMRPTAWPKSNSRMTASTCCIASARRLPSFRSSKILPPRSTRSRMRNGGMSGLGLNVRGRIDLGQFHGCCRRLQEVCVYPGRFPLSPADPSVPRLGFLLFNGNSAVLPAIARSAAAVRQRTAPTFAVRPTRAAAWWQRSGSAPPDRANWRAAAATARSEHFSVPLQNPAPATRRV